MGTGKSSEKVIRAEQAAIPETVVAPIPCFHVGLQTDTFGKTTCLDCGAEITLTASPVSSKPQIFLDCDGVLADFDSYAEKIFGLLPRNAEEKLGAKRFWCDLQSHDGFYRNLPLMPDARELFEAVEHLSPIILTGLPLGDWAEPQKREWGAKHFPHTTMICCMSADKRNHMKPGDVLVDDFLKYKNLWEEAGGIFIHHTSAATSVAELKRLGILVAPKPTSSELELLLAGGEKG